jgi:hypothetical protein
MTDRTATNQPRAASERSLEQSLREGPADEGGYRAEAVDLSADAHVQWRRGLRAGRSSVRLGRRSPGTSPVFASLDSVAILLVVVFIGFVLLQRTIPGGSGVLPLPTERASASPIPVPVLTETFVSTRNGFSVRYPEGWSTRAATTSWLPNTLVPMGSPAFDELKLQGVARLVVASQRLGAGQSEASWLASFGQDYYLRRCSGDRAAWPRIMVDGRSGYLDLNACPLPADETFSTPDVAFDVIVFAADRAYRIGLDGVVDLGYFEAILATVRLDPASAMDPPEGT